VKEKVRVEKWTHEGCQGVLGGGFVPGFVASVPGVAAAGEGRTELEAVKALAETLAAIIKGREETAHELEDIRMAAIERLRAQVAELSGKSEKPCAGLRAKAAKQVAKARWGVDP
jgi:predicted ATP-dependent serine protease